MWNTLITTATTLAICFAIFFVVRVLAEIANLKNELKRTENELKETKEKFAEAQNGDCCEGEYCGICKNSYEATKVDVYGHSLITAHLCKKKIRCNDFEESELELVRNQIAECVKEFVKSKNKTK